MRGAELVHRRVVLAPDAFAEIVIWALPRRLAGSVHSFKYRLAYVVGTDCVLRYDNESGKGDHRHYGKAEMVYAFAGPDKLMADFFADVTRWNHENSRS
ncbi:MAG: toxin-antitoxin system TumE family protein [Nevskiales bacterium]